MKDLHMLGIILFAYAFFRGIFEEGEVEEE